MKDFILLMHNDAIDIQLTNDADAWSRYFAVLKQSGCFDGGSSITGGQAFNKSGKTVAVSTHIGGYIRVRADSIEQAKVLLSGNPVYEAGGTVEIRELPRD